MSDKYILENKKAIPADLLTWARWFEGADRRVNETLVNSDIRVSTVFLGIDHDFVGNGPPLIFETMIFGGLHDQWQDRYSTWEEALAGHADAVRRASGAQDG